MDLTMANQGGNNNMLRDYRKGNWNLQETMVLIEAKKMDDQRRMKRVGESSERGKPAELRWKWVEDYCWKNGCLRSQNQCNDKWDNLMRDFKKVREYERRVAERGGEEKSYWRIDKNERKDNNLPSNMLPQIYEALVEVVERKGQREAAASGGAGSSRANVVPATSIVEKSAASHVLGHLSMPPPVQQYPIIQAPAMLLPLPPPAQAPAEPPTIPSSQPLPASDSETSEYSDSPAKRRKRGSGGGDGEGTSGGVGTLEEVGSAISKSASIIAEAIRSCEEREERRHREVVSLQQRRLEIEESKAEMNRQGINGLVDAINKLANSILALAAHKDQSTSK
ncbi:trihelix transcription factor ASR3 isoform X2 [Sesamum indicum]|uniref:Trihelix transcription factor ASR3 isoform X2 n=1 Tax=Sesamum indicum TaxID=4182 RepID=A0A6I9UAS3_SESIN|nr:trihelix transcription factor ASR3 isoform X2 [Sesamum indicum]